MGWNDNPNDWGSVLGGTWGKGRTREARGEGREEVGKGQGERCQEERWKRKIAPRVGRFVERLDEIKF